MVKICLTAFDLAQRFVGSKEISGSMDNPQIMAMLRLDNTWPGHDEVPWCSAFVNYICWLLRLPRSKSLAARSWLQIGSAVETPLYAEVGFDIVILKRAGSQAGPEVLNAEGHVGFFAGKEGDNILLLGGNQSDQVNISRFPSTQLLGIRRLYDA
jgi:uncharacterized protein (TIGR02594 family)